LTTKGGNSYKPIVNGGQQKHVTHPTDWTGIIITFQENGNGGQQKHVTHPTVGILIPTSDNLWTNYLVHPTLIMN